ncbi:hypothetical protein SUGI_0986660 [Cryptomeria japonica]|nr:hypothetical protein SUGI_0986660 [Cryptomeria japonica]
MSHLVKQFTIIRIQTAVIKIQKTGGLKYSSSNLNEQPRCLFGQTSSPCISTEMIPNIAYAQESGEAASRLVQNTEVNDDELEHLAAAAKQLVIS